MKIANDLVAYVKILWYHNSIMRGSIFKLLCIIFLTVVIMSEPPEKKFKNVAVAKAQRILRNSVVVPEITISSELTSAGSSAMSGYYQTAAGQWKKRERSTAPIVALLLFFRH